MTTLAEKIAIMQAFAQGKAIEVTVDGEDNWGITDSPLWDWEGFEYRIANLEKLAYMLLCDSAYIDNKNY